MFESLSTRSSIDDEERQEETTTVVYNLGTPERTNNLNSRSASISLPPSPSPSPPNSPSPVPTTTRHLPSIQQMAEPCLAITDCSNRSVRRTWGVCTLLGLIVASILIGVSLKKLTSLEYGVEYDKWGKTLDDSAKQGGLFAGPPGYYFVKFPSTQITEELSDTCLSRDGLRVGFQVSFQFQLPKDSILNIINKYRDFKGWSMVVVAAGNSAIQHTCSAFNVTDFQSLRTVIQDNMLENLKLKLEGSLDGITDDGVYAYASSLQLKYVDLPKEYRNAVAEKQRAEEDIALARNQRTQEVTKAQTELLAAEEEALKIMNTAWNDGNVTEIQARLKAEETLFAFQKQQDVLAQAKTSFSLNANGILAYMTNQLYAATPNLNVVVGEPAKISRKDEL